MKITDKINFKQPKYMLPAILYIPLLVASYLIFDLFGAEKLRYLMKLFRQQNI